ncbi:MAG: hypothetical protein AB1896_11615 [Thermodesulfobacteriota bacterium]
MEPLKDLSLTTEMNTRFDELFQEENPPVDRVVSLPPGPPADSTLRNLKSLVLTPDWEITDQTLDRLNFELESLSQAFQGRRNVLPLLRLLRSLGKYIHRKRAESHPEAIKLFHSVFQTLEQVLPPDGGGRRGFGRLVAAEIEKFRVLKEKIARNNPPSSTEKSDVPALGASSLGLETHPRDRTTRIAIEATAPYENVDRLLKPAEDSGPVPAESETKDIAAGRAPKGLMVEEADLDLKLDEPAPPPDLARMLPHEAFAYALEEIKKTIKAEFGVLRAELRLWRLDR